MRGLAPLAILLPLVALPLAGCVVAPEVGTPVPSPAAPFALVYRLEGGPYDDPVWLHVAHWGTRDLVQDDGRVRPTRIFDVFTDAAPLVPESGPSSDVTRVLIDAATGRVVFTSWVCIDPPPTYHCSPDAPTLSGAQTAPFFWATSLLWDSTWRAGETVAFPRMAGEGELRVTWTPGSGEAPNTFVVEADDVDEKWSTGFVGDFSGAVHFGERSSFPERVSVSRLGRSGWDSILSARLEASAPVQPLADTPRPEPVLLPPADQPWTSAIPPGARDLPVGDSATVGSAWDAIQALDEFQSWVAEHPVPFLQSFPGSRSWGWSSGPCGEPVCLFGEQGSGFEVTVAAPDGQRGLAEVEHWTDEGVSGTLTRGGSSASFDDLGSDEPGDPRRGRSYMDASTLADLACGLDPACDGVHQVGFRLGDDGGAAYSFRWGTAQPGHGIVPGVAVRADTGQIWYATLPLESAQRFLGPWPYT